MPRVTDTGSVDRSQPVVTGFEDGLASVPISDWFRIWLTMRARHLPERLSREIQMSTTRTAVNMFTGLSMLGVVSTSSVVIALLPLDQRPARIWAGVHALVYIWIGFLVLYLRHRMKEGTLTSAAFNKSTAPMVLLGGILWGTVPMVVATEPVSHFYLATSMSGLFCMVGFFWPGGQWPICVLYTVSLLVSLDVVYYTHRRAEFGLAVALTICELVMLVVMSVVASAALVRARFETILARDRKQMIQLLMQDYERGGHDWVWETDVDLRLSHVPPKMMVASHGDPRFEAGVLLTDLLASDIEALNCVRLNQPFQAHLMANGPDGRGEVRLWGRPHLLSDTCLGYRGVGSDEDATRRKAEAERTKERLDSMVTLTSGLAHDFNNLLATILGSVELAGTAPGLPDLASRHLKRAIEACMRSRRITGDLAVASGYDVTTEPAVFAVASTIETILAELTPLYPDIRIDFDRSHNQGTDDLWTTADRSHFMRTIRNLTENACQATERVDRPGVVTVSCDAVRLGNREPMVNIVVTDNGPGIPEEHRSRVFEPFYSTRKTSGGTGLGLAVSAGFARQAGGSLSIDPIDVGACFRLTLPNVAAPEQSGSDGSPTDTDPLRYSDDLGFEGSFLIVEDDDHVAELLVGLIESFGATALRAATVAEAKLHKGHTADITCVVCDLVLPDGEGFEVIEALRGKDPTLKAVYISGFSRRLPATVAPNLRCPFVPKPFSTLELSNAVRAAGVPVVRRQQLAPTTTLGRRS